MSCCCHTEPCRSGKPVGKTPDETETTSRLALQLKDYRLTTAEILYHLPDHPGILQTYVWQELDIAPRYPVLNKFLEFWRRELDGQLHSVRIASASLIKPPTFRHPEAYLQLHYNTQQATACRYAREYPQPAHRLVFGAM